MGYGWVPGLSQKFDSVTKIAQVTMPVLVVHGAEDRVRPAALERGALCCGAATEETPC